MSGYIYTLLDHLLFTPKLDFDSRFDSRTDSRYKIFKQFQNNVLVQYSLFLQLETGIFLEFHIFLTKIRRVIMTPYCPKYYNI